MPQKKPEIIIFLICLYSNGSEIANIAAKAFAVGWTAQQI